MTDLQGAIEGNTARLPVVEILTDHHELDYGQIVVEASLVVDTRNATRSRAASVGRVVTL